MPKNRFSNYSLGGNAPALGSIVVTPSNSEDLDEAIRAVTIGTAGVIAWRGIDDVDNVTASLPPGTYSLQAKRILATGTTATQITGWI
ncbi:spike base protein, RCAP_Rcc01079 family [Paracoccus laeviglucosivorans]|uniref:Uncharacterized protein n=1 Tax=Paracoccus laeviglucosivorans TaxID=1197861 RepID=A0A521E418_9RHOB|nr:hypothetical protein [Paracoccus laeviglucosivorans]SMO78602.1 hypothetical protein SAMN06265221_11138 [Paracoccus laeviglucosivorans]